MPIHLTRDERRLLSRRLHKRMWDGVIAAADAATWTSTYGAQGRAVPGGTVQMFAVASAGRSDELLGSIVHTIRHGAGCRGPEGITWHCAPLVSSRVRIVCAGPVRFPRRAPISKAA